MRRMTAFLLGLAMAAGMLQAAEPVFLEEGKRVVVNIESAPLTSYWRKETKVPGYAGSGYYVWRHGSGYDYDRTAGLGTLTYRVKITNPGKYTLRMYNYRCAADNSEQNDCYVKVDSGPWEKMYVAKTYGCYWNTRVKLERNHKENVWPDYEGISAGYHTIKVSGRSYGYGISRFYFYINGEVWPNPCDSLLPESPREGEQTAITIVDFGSGIADFPAFPNPVDLRTINDFRLQISDLRLYNMLGQMVPARKEVMPGVYYIGTEAREPKRIMITK